MEGKRTKCNIKKTLFGITEMECIGFIYWTEMEYIGLWVTHYGVKPIDKNTSNKKYEATNFLKISTSVYGCRELLPQYVVKTLTYVSAFN